MITDHPIESTGTSQCALILARLQQTPGEWVPMPALARVSGAYAVHSRVNDLRRRSHRIDHRNLHHGRKILSQYRLAESPPQP